MSTGGGRDDGEGGPGRGRALARSDEDLDLMAQIGESDLDDAAADWRRRAPRAFRGLLDAREPGPEDEERDDGR